jgi:hypothetical protein
MRQTPALYVKPGAKKPQSVAECGIVQPLTPSVYKLVRLVKEQQRLKAVLFSPQVGRVSAA